MTAWRFIHLVSLILWFGAAAADIVLELVLRRTASEDGQRALIRLHHLVDLVLETPAILGVLCSGALLLYGTGRLTGGAPWPPALVWKLALGGIAAAANLACVVFVVKRAQACGRVGSGGTPGTDREVRRWTARIFMTIIAAPAAVAALWLAVSLRP